LVGPRLEFNFHYGIAIPYNTPIMDKNYKKIPYCLFASQNGRLKAEGTFTATTKYHGVFGRS
jgi:hypothetical protein